MLGENPGDHMYNLGWVKPQQSKENQKKSEIYLIT